MRKEDDACYNCPDRKENCHKTCKRGKIAPIKRELEKRKIEKYIEEHTYKMTEAKEKTVKKNRKKYNEHGERRK